MVIIGGYQKWVGVFLLYLLLFKGDIMLLFKGDIMKVNRLNNLPSFLLVAVLVAMLSACHHMASSAHQASLPMLTNLPKKDTTPHHHAPLGTHATHANHYEHGGFATNPPTHSYGDHHDHHEHSLHHWDYRHHDQWGDLEVNRLCKTGQTQSPLNIHKVTRPKTQHFELQGNYQPQDFNIKNNGHTIVFDAKDTNQSTLIINGTTYKLLQFHYHIPSEHTVMNAHYPLELHFVHQNEENGLAVVGVLVDRGEHNAEFAKILTNLPSLGASDSTLERFNVQMLMPQGATYAYEGSLTTPPCDEKVQWLLKATPIYASYDQLATLSALYDGNNRPVQRQGERVIWLVE